MVEAGEKQEPRSVAIFGHFRLAATFFSPKPNLKISQ